MGDNPLIKRMDSGKGSVKGIALPNFKTAVIVLLAGD